MKITLASKGVRPLYWAWAEILQQLSDLCMIHFEHTFVVLRQCGHQQAKPSIISKVKISSSKLDF